MLPFSGSAHGTSCPSLWLSTRQALEERFFSLEQFCLHLELRVELSVELPVGSGLEPLEQAPLCSCHPSSPCSGAQGPAACVALCRVLAPIPEDLLLGSD